jgi:hypothetical protein
MRRPHAITPLEVTIGQRNVEFAILRELTADGLSIWNALGSHRRSQITAAIAAGQLSIAAALDKYVPSSNQEPQQETSI